MIDIERLLLRVFNSQLRPEIPVTIWLIKNGKLQNIVLIIADSEKLKTLTLRELQTNIHFLIR